MLWVWQVLVSAGVAALLAVSASAGAGVTALACAALALGVGLGWPALLRLPHPVGTRLVVLVTGVCAAAVAGAGLSDERPLAAVAAIAALAVPLAFTHELLRRDGRDRLVESVTGTYAGQAVAVLGCGWALLPAVPHGAGSVIVAVLAVVVTRLLAVAVPLPQAIAPWLGIGAAVVAGAALSPAVDGPARGGAAILCASVAAVVVAADRMLGVEQRAARSAAAPAALSAALAPLAAAGMAAYAVARLVVGPL
ncbi:MAG: hypothetical protein U0Q15_08675 [Kineosporiaceae bacterium]